MTNQLFPHADTAGDVALMPGEACPAACAACAADAAGLTLYGGHDGREWWASLEDVRGTLATYAALRVEPMHAAISRAIESDSFPFAERTARA